jgi:hypothetical protein
VAEMEIREAREAQIAFMVVDEISHDVLILCHGGFYGADPSRIMRINTTTGISFIFFPSSLLFLSHSLSLSYFAYTGVKKIIELPKHSFNSFAVYGNFIYIINTYSTFFLAYDFINNSSM